MRKGSSTISARATPVPRARKRRLQAGHPPPLRDHRVCITGEKKPTGEPAAAAGDEQLA